MNYFDVKAFSASAIKAGAVSMLRMAHYMTSGTEKTAAMKQGTLQHRAVLEPLTLQSMVVADYDGRTNAGKALLAQHGENLIKPAAFAELEAVGDRVHGHPAVREFGLLEGGTAEKEIYWTDDGIDCKAKLDYLAPEHFVEYKTCNNLAGFTRSAAAMFYHLQLGWYGRAAYCHDVKPRKCYIIAQESKAPFDVAVFRVQDIYLKSWHEDCRRIVDKYLSGDRQGAFPEIMTFELPAYAIGTDVNLDPEQMIQF